MHAAQEIRVSNPAASTTSAVLPRPRPRTPTPRVRDLGQGDPDWQLCKPVVDRKRPLLSFAACQVLHRGFGNNQSHALVDPTAGGSGWVLRAWSSER